MKKCYTEEGRLCYCSGAEICLDEERNKKNEERNKRAVMKSREEIMENVAD